MVPFMGAASFQQRVQMLVGGVPEVQGLVGYAVWRL